MGNISFFVPHIGCPVKCSFCNQHSISGTQTPLSVEEVKKTLKEQAELLQSKCSETGIAFFGGSFTAIDESIQTELLNAAKEAVEKYGYSGIRFSTRPDAIDPDVIIRLSEYPIKAIELGAQSMNDEILEANNRGHFAKDTIRASKLIKSAGYELTLQMMIGLYKDTIEGAYDTARKIAKLEPDSVRIYPTIVLSNTKLGEMYQSGDYIPLELNETIECCGELLEFFDGKNIKVIKLGLHEEVSMKENMLAGPHHPALRELCEGYVFAKHIKAKLEKDNRRTAKVYLSVKDYSKLAGHKGYFKDQLKEQGYDIEMIQDKNLIKNQLLIV